MYWNHELTVNHQLNLKLFCLQWHVHISACIWPLRSKTLMNHIKECRVLSLKVYQLIWKQSLFWSLLRFQNCLLKWNNMLHLQTIELFKVSTSFAWSIPFVTHWRAHMTTKRKQCNKLIKHMVGISILSFLLHFRH